MCVCVCVCVSAPTVRLSPARPRQDLSAPTAQDPPTHPYQLHHDTLPLQSQGRQESG